MRATIMITIDGKMNYVQEEAEKYLNKLIWITGSSKMVGKMMCKELIYNSPSIKELDVNIRYLEQF